MRQVMSFMCWSVVFLSLVSCLSRVRRFSFTCVSVFCHVFVGCPSRVRRLSFSVRRLSFKCWSVFFHVFVSCLSPAKLLNLSGFVLNYPHSFCFFPDSAPHFFLFSKRGNSTHNTHNIYNFVENQALDSQQTHNKTPTRSQHLTTSPRVTRKCCELL